jgi:hypothetical protein
VHEWELPRPALPSPAPEPEDAEIDEDELGEPIYNPLEDEPGGTIHDAPEPSYAHPDADSDF